MTVKEFIEVLSRANQDAEIFCEDYYSSLTPLGSIWLYKDYNRLIVSPYKHSSDVSQPSFYSNIYSESTFYEKYSNLIQDGGIIRRIEISTSRDKLGNIYLCVDYINNNCIPDYVMFSHLSSALDFIHSNFK